LYRVYKHLPGCQTIDNRFDNRLYRVNEALKTRTSGINNACREKCAFSLQVIGDVFPNMGVSDTVCWLPSI